MDKLDLISSYEPNMKQSFILDGSTDIWSDQNKEWADKKEIYIVVLYIEYNKLG